MSWRERKREETYGDAEVEARLEGVADGCQYRRSLGRSGFSSP